MILLYGFGHMLEFIREIVIASAGVGVLIWGFCIIKFTPLAKLDFLRGWGGLALCCIGIVAFVAAILMFLGKVSMKAFNYFF
jgi:hypothetical protein